MKGFSDISRLVWCFVMLVGMAMADLSVCAQEVSVLDSTKTALPKALQKRKRMAQQRHDNQQVRPRMALADSAKWAIMADSARLANEVIAREKMRADSIAENNREGLEAFEAPVDTTALANQLSIDTLVTAEEVPEKKVFIPDPAKATWMAVVFPGGGQIYNRKYWKLPIVYGGFVGCAYALTWNGQMYSDYSQAYLDIMDDNPATDSFLDFLPPGYNVDANLDYLKKVIKRKKDSYRRYRDLSIFCFIGVYIVSIIDAYVDAELSSFDISQDLTLKMEPTVIQDNRWRPGENQAYGLQCSLRF